MRKMKEAERIISDEGGKFMKKEEHHEVEEEARQLERRM